MARPQSGDAQMTEYLTAEQNYDADYALAWEMVEPVMRARIANAPSAYDADFLAEQLPGWCGDALNNDWIVGISIAQWARRALEIARG